MNQATQGNSSYSYASLAIPVKRKRGRPRKDRSLNHVESVPVYRSLNRVESVPVPPGFETVNGNQPSQVDPIGDANNGIVGQAVTGVVEAAFDAGYLLAVKIGNSNITLRGVVFKPGHYSPVTVENDVAPHAQMIRRSEIHFSTESQNRVRARKPQSREKNDQQANYPANGSPPVNQLQRIAPLTANLVKAKYGSIVSAPSVPPVGSRGTVVPVVLQPVNISNGTPPATLKGQHVQMGALQQGSTPPTNATQPSQSHTIPQVTPKGVKSVNSPSNHATPVPRQGEEAKSMKSTQSSETHIGKSSAEDSGTASEQEDGDLNDEPLSIEPLQTVHSVRYNQSAYVSNTAGNMNTSGRMTELLQALQEK